MLPDRVRRRFRLALHRPQAAAAEMDDEIRFHLDMRAEQLVARGLAPDEARSEAVRRFGDLESAGGRLRQRARRREARMLRRERVGAVWQDLAFAVRQLRRSPGFTAAVVLTFGLAIAANATMFGIVDRLLLRPPAYLAAADRTQRVYLMSRSPEGEDLTNNNISYKRYLELRDGARGVEETAAFFNTEMVVGRGEASRELRSGLVSASFWRMFEARPALGRFFADAEDRTPGGEPVAVLGHAFWQSQYGGDPNVLGRSLDVGGRVYTIVGVAPKGFTGMSTSPLAVFVPITAAGFDMFDERYFTGHNVSWMEMIVRRRAGVSPEAATAELTAAYARSMASNPNARPLAESRPRALLGSIIYDRGPKAGGNAKVATWLGGMSLIVLLIACANVANLLLARARRRGREIAVRVALGIGRGRLVAQLLTESVLLGLLGGAVGLALAYWGGGILRATLLPDVDWSTGALDLRLLVATAAAALVAGVLAGLAPAVQSTAPALSDTLKTGLRAGAVRRSRMRTVLLVAQVALSVVLLTGAGLFARSLHNVRSLDLGFDPERVLFANAELRGTKLTPEEGATLNERMIERALALPEVEHASVTRSVPFWMTWQEDLFVPGVDSVSRLGDFVTNAVSPAYFATMGTRVVRGRGLTDADRRGTPSVAVVSASMARLLWPGREAIGQCIKVGADTMPCTTVVGVAEDVRRDDLAGDSPMLQYYLSAAQLAGTGRRNGGLLIRTRGDAAQSTETVRRALQQLLPGAAFASARPLQGMVDENIRPWRLGATMFAVFGLLALVLAAVGLYGVIAFDVTQRTHEMGVRVALGAQRRDVLRLVVLEGVRLAAVGIAVGGLLAVAGGRYLSALLFQVSPRDPAVLAAGGLTLLAVAVAASLLPALRAVRVDPNTALRTE